MKDNNIIMLVIQVVVLIFSVVVHEVAHGLAAYALGDSTARDNGRLTLNPLPHLDPMMTLVVPVLFYFSLGTAFGGAKPVPVNYFNLRNPKRDMMLIGAAGPLSNFVLAFVSLLALVLLSRTGLPYISGVVVVLLALYQINLLLIAFNLIPIPPLDGSRILTGLLPPGPARAYASLEPYGFIIIVALLFTGLLGWIYRPLFNGLNLLLQMLVPF